jgi:hypothetical protein
MRHSDLGDKFSVLSALQFTGDLHLLVEHMDANVFPVEARKVESGDFPFGAGVLSNSIPVYKVSKFLFIL